MTPARSVSNDLRARPDHRRRRMAVMTLLLCPLALLGCERSDQVVTYTIPTDVPEELRPGEQQLLAVMFPRADQVWFFKLMGPEAAVESVQPEFRQFVTEIEFDDSGEPILDELPENWRRGADKPMRFASIDINTPTKQLDLSISSLSRPSDGGDAWDQYVVQNVNRWRGQVGLEPSEENWSGGERIDIAAAQGPSVWVELTGQPDEGASMRPGGGGMMPGGRGGMQPPFASPPPGVAGTGPRGATSATPPSSPAPASSIDYELPEGWREKRASGMRLVALDVGPEDQPAEVTLIPAGGDLRSNVARWMGQVAGQPPADPAVDAMLEQAERLDVSGKPGQRFIIEGEPESSEISIDATVVPLEGGRSMFIKLTGPPEVVAAQQESMRTFLRSLSF